MKYGVSLSGLLITYTYMYARALTPCMLVTIEYIHVQVRMHVGVAIISVVLYISSAYISQVIFSIIWGYTILNSVSENY